MARDKQAKSVFATFWANASYKSFGKPSFFDRGSEDTGLPLSQYDTQTSDHHPSSVLATDKREPSARWTAHQLFYIFGSHGIGAMIISGGVNFAIAYAMYTTTDDPIRLFQFPNTLAGDTAVTIIIQCIVTWLLEMIIVNNDLRRGKVQPIGFITEPPAGGSTWSRAVRWYMLLDLPKTLRNRRGSPWRQFLYIVAQAVRAFMVSVVCFALMFGPCIGILTAVGVKDGGDWLYASRWAPEVFKLVLGGVVALVTTPFFAMFWIVKCGWKGGYQRPTRFMINENNSSRS